MANEQFREQHERDREAGLKARHETKLARAIRKQVAEEIADRFETMALNEDLPEEWPHVLSWAAGLAREIGTKEAGNG